MADPEPERATEATPRGARSPGETPAAASFKLDMLDSDNLDQVKVDTGITAGAMPAKAAAGVLLTKIVLGMVMASIVILALYLFVIDLKNGASLDDAYASVMHQATVGPDFPDGMQVDRLAKLMASALADNARALSPDEERDGLAALNALGRVPTLSDGQRDDLRTCIPLPPAASREATLRRCVDVVAVLQRGAIGAAANLEKIRLLADFAKEVNEHRQTFRAFWLQVAQLILLNLLLPLLTALLGYIFGTTQPSGSNPG